MIKPVHYVTLVELNNDLNRNLQYSKINTLVNKHERIILILEIFLIAKKNRAVKIAVSFVSSAKKSIYMER